MNVLPSIISLFPFSILLNVVTGPQIIPAAAAYALEKAVYDKENPQEHDVDNSDEKKGAPKSSTSERKVTKELYCKQDR